MSAPDDIVARLRLYANASIEGGWASVFRADLTIAADEIERLEALVNAGAARLKESRERNVRLLSQLQEYEVREL